MSPQRWHKLDALYDAAVELSPEERARFLDEQCAGDPDLRRELTEMLRDKPGGFTGVVQQAAAAVLSGPEAWIGQRLGPYRVLRLIGFGGMGAVYEGAREDSFEKRVAIKLVNLSFDSDIGRRSFQKERQILARLEHPHIARLLDGGDYQDRIPYLVMEYVEGEPLIAAASRMSTGAKLRLFQKILSAVSFAHRELVVHRDLKPSNILVTADGEPKLLDFGIARLMGEDPGGETARTLTSGPMMTPDYASPEQVRGEPVGIGSDIYSLGATLYELLSGARPHGLSNYSTAEVYRAICETEPRPPSESAADPAVQRELRGDLDILVLHAMAKDPAARYSSADAFGVEIQLYLEGRPLSVRRASAVARGWKFVKRNALAVGAVVAVAVSLIGGVTFSALEARRAQRRFNQVRELANTFLFQFYDQVTPLPGSTAVRASMVDTARKYLDGLAKEAGGDQGLLLELAAAYERLGSVQGQVGNANLGRVEDARVSFRRALELYARAGVGPRSPIDLRVKAANVWWLLARIENAGYHDDDAEADARRVLELLGPEVSDPAARRLQALTRSTFGEVRLRQGKAAEAVSLLESAQRGLQDLQASGYSHPRLREDLETAWQRTIRAKVFIGDLDGAASSNGEFLRSLPPCEDQGPPGRACRVLAVRLTFAGNLYAAVEAPNLDDPAKGATYYEKALQISERVVASDPEDRAARYDLAVRYGKLGDAVWQSDPKRALDLYERAMATARPLVSKEQSDDVRTSYLSSIARPLTKLGRFAEARQSIEEAFRIGGRTNSHSPYADRVAELAARLIEPSILAAEGRRAETRQLLATFIQDAQGLRAERPTDFTPVYFVSQAYRLLASIASGEERRAALLQSAATWNSWPATSFTLREAERDLAAAGQ